MNSEKCMLGRGKGGKGKGKAGKYYYKRSTMGLTQNICLGICTAGTFGPAW